MGANSSFEMWLEIRMGSKGLEQQKKRLYIFFLILSTLILIWWIGWC